MSDIRHTAHNQDTAETDRTGTSDADKYTQETPISHHRSQLSTAGLIQSYSQSQSPTVKATSQQLQLQSQSITITQLGPPSDPAPAFDRIAEFVANMSEQHNWISDYHYQSIQHRNYTQGIGSAHQPSFRDFVPRFIEEQERLGLNS